MSDQNLPCVLAVSLPDSLSGRDRQLDFSNFPVIHEAESFGITRKLAAEMGAVSAMERMQALYPKMRKRGIRVLPGGDYGFPYNPIGRNARDLQLFVELFGYTPIETLVAATKLGGELMGRGELIGLLKPGYLADLLVVNGDPTLDVRILQERDRLKMIMKNGAFHLRKPVNTAPAHWATLQSNA